MAKIGNPPPRSPPSPLAVERGSFGFALMKMKQTKSKCSSCTQLLSLVKSKAEVGFDLLTMMFTLSKLVKRYHQKGKVK